MYLDIRFFIFLIINFKKFTKHPVYPRKLFLQLSRQPRLIVARTTKWLIINSFKWSRQKETKENKENENRKGGGRGGEKRISINHGSRVEEQRSFNRNDSIKLR